jgi:predicted RNA binding protein YcfA (HicA-like mRNA interferase family)
VSRREIPRDLRRLAKHLRSQGWQVDMTKGGHVVFIGPRGQKVFTAATSSDRRGRKNLIAELRRRGAIIPTGGKHT